MEKTTYEFLLILGIVIPGLLFFTGLEKSLKTDKKAMKIVYLIFATLCAVVVMECILRLTLDYNDTLSFMNNFLKIIMRVIQAGLCIIGILMSIGIALKNKDAVRT